MLSAYRLLRRYFAVGFLMPFSSHTSAPRFSSSEFTRLIQDRLNELEERTDTTPQHRVLLAVLRQELAQHTKACAGPDDVPARPVA
jgi:hypothetical protein